MKNTTNVIIAIILLCIFATGTMTILNLKQAIDYDWLIVLMPVLVPLFFIFGALLIAIGITIYTAVKVKK